MDLPYFDTTTRPWFGPTRRAKECLGRRRRVSEPVEALAGLVAALGANSRHIEQVRFIDFKHRQKGNFRFTIALAWMSSSAEARQQVFDVGPEFTREFGWYPLVQGSRIGSKREFAQRSNQLRRRPMPRFGVAGDLHSVSSAVPAEGGCSIRLATRTDSLLLDTGLPGNFEGPTDDALIVLSHVHRDHAGSLCGDGVADKPIVLTEANAHSLVGAGLLSEEELVRRAVIAQEERDLQLGQGVSLRAFPVPHCPGASGFVFRDRTSAVFYSGDICLATARHDFLPDFLARVHAEDVPRKTVLLDATMAGRKDGASGARTAKAVQDLFSAVPDVALVSQDASQLLYAHLDLFATIKDDPATRDGFSTIMTSRARPMVRLLHFAFIDRREARVDPLLAAQYGKSMSAWAESRWLYWLDEMDRAPADGVRIWLLHPSELSALKGRAAAVAWIGRPPKEELDLPLVDIDTSPWTQHSDAATLARSVRALSAHGHVRLFHNFRRRIDSFIRTHDLPRCSALVEEPIRV